MNSNYKHALLELHVDFDVAVGRVAGSEDIYERLLKKFLLDPNYPNLKTCIITNDYNDAFQFAHTLKGLSGNLGLTPIYDSVYPIVESLRNHTTEGITELFPALETAYDQICNIIRRYT